MHSFQRVLFEYNFSLPQKSPAKLKQTATMKTFKVAVIDNSKFYLNFVSYK